MTFDDRPPGEVPLTTSYSVSKPAPEPADDAAPPPADEPRIYIPGREAPRISRNKLIAAGLAGALALGLFFGLVMAPKLNEPDKPRIERITPASGEDPRLQIQVTTRQAPEPTARSAGRLDAAGTVIQPAPAEGRAEREGGGIVGALGRMFGGDGDEEARTAPVQRVERPPEPRPDPRAERLPPIVVAEAEDDASEVAPPDRDAPPDRARRVASPSFNCRHARTRAEMMVCEDPRLAAADRRLAAAFRRAVDSGVPYGPLRRQQDRWLAARERAAVSPEAVHMVYMQRIEELENLGEGW